MDGGWTSVAPAKGSKPAGSSKAKAKEEPKAPKPVVPKSDIASLPAFMVLDVSPLMRIVLGERPCVLRFLAQFS